MYIPSRTAHHRGSSVCSRPGGRGNPLGTRPKPPSLGGGTRSRSVPIPHGTNLVSFKTCHQRTPCQPNPFLFLFPVCSLYPPLHTRTGTHTHKYTQTHTKCLEPAVRVSSEVSFIKKYTTKGQKGGHRAEHDGGSIKN